MDFLGILCVMLIQPHTSKIVFITYFGYLHTASDISLLSEVVTHV